MTTATLDSSGITLEAQLSAMPVPEGRPPSFGPSLVSR